MKKQELFNFFNQEHQSFNLKTFFETETVQMDNGALILITPNQVIFSRNIDKGKGIGSGSHDITKKQLTKILYNIPLTDEEETKEQVNKEKYLTDNQNIMLRLMNETPADFFGLCGNIKVIWIDLPSSITSTQLTFLKQLEKEYGKTLKQVSIQQQQKTNRPLISFFNHQKQPLSDHTLKQAIEYAEKNLVNDNMEIIDEDIIIGETIERIKQK